MVAALSALSRFAGELVVGLFLEPFGAVGGLDGEQGFEVDHGRGGDAAVLASWP